MALKTFEPHPYELSIDTVCRRSHQTSLSPFLVILSLRFRTLGLSPEKSLLWAREIFEKHPSKKILQAYDQIIDTLCEETNNLTVRELCEKMQILSLGNIDHIEGLAFLGVKKDRKTESIKMNLISRLLYQFYTWNELSSEELRLFSKIVLYYFSPLLEELVPLIKKEGTVCLDELDPQKKPETINQYTEKAITGLEEMLRKHGQYQKWLCQTENIAQAKK